MEYNFSGKLTLDDFIKMNNFYAIEVFFNRKISIVLYILFITFFTGFLVYNIALYSTVRFFEDLLPILLLGLIILFITKRPKILYKKSFKENKIAQEEQVFRINEKDIKIASESISITLTKENIKKIRFDKDSIYIFTVQGMNNIIKSRYLDKFDELKNFVKINYI